MWSSHGTESQTREKRMTDENDDTTVLNQNRNTEQDSYRKLVAYHIPHLLTDYTRRTYFVPVLYIL